MKRYPFSVQKHAHDIEFRYNRVRNLMYDMENQAAPMDTEEYDKLCDMMESLEDLLDAVMGSSDGRVCYLTGPQIGLAKETVIWASNQRANSLLEAGKTQYLPYC